MIPIRRYNILKSTIAVNLSQVLRWASAKSGNTHFPKNLRRLASQLNDSFRNEIPGWYKSVLASRDEYPENAARHLIALADIENKRVVGSHVERIENNLNLK